MNLFLEVNFISSEVLLTVLQGATFLWQYLATFFLPQQQVPTRRLIKIFSIRLTLVLLGAGTFDGFCTIESAWTQEKRMQEQTDFRGREEELGLGVFSLCKFPPKN